MIRFSARGAYLVVVPQRRVFNGDRVLIRNRAFISFFVFKFRDNQMCKTELKY